TGTSWVDVTDIGVAGSGTENYLTKWGSGGQTLFDSQVYDNSTFVGIGGTAVNTNPHIYVEANTGDIGIGTTNPSAKLDIAIETSGLRTLELGYNQNADSAAYSIYNSIDTTGPDSNSLSGLYNIGSAGNKSRLYGVNNALNENGSISTIYVYGVYNNLSSSTNSTVANLYGTYNDITTTSQGTKTAYGTYYKTNNSSTGGTQYAFYGDMSSGTATKWGLYLNGEDKNYLSSNLGIGTTNPGYALEVTGDLSVGTTANIDTLNLTGMLLDDGGEPGTTGQILSSIGTGTSWIDISSIGISGTGTTNYISKWINSTTLANSQVFDNSTFIGIGGTAVTTNPHIYVEADIGRIGIGTTGPTSQLHVVQTQAVDAFRVDDATNDTTPFIIDQSGNVGIGITGPLGKLQVSTTTSDDDVIVQRWGYNTAAYGDTYHLDLKQTVTAGVVRWNFSQMNASSVYNDVLVLDRGNVGIGTTNPLYKLDVSGNVNIGGSAFIGTVPSVADNNAVLTIDGTTVSQIDTTSWDKASADDVWVLNGDSGTAQTIGAGDTAYFQGGIGIGTTVGGTDDLTIYVDEAYDFSWLGTHSYSAADFNFISATGFTMDVTNDLYLDADGGDILFADGGAWYGGWEAGGYFGIGTTNPTALLDLSSISSSTAFLGFNLDWNPASTTTLTGDLFSINIGSSGNANNLFTIQDTDSDLFSVSETQITSAIPHQFTSSGDVSIAYDLIFTNDTSSQIESYGPFSIIAGESHESNNLTLKTYNLGDIILDSGSGNLWADGTNVGIGTTNPNYKLEVAGNGYFSTNLTVGTTANINTLNLVGMLLAGSAPGTSGQILSSIGTGTSWVDVTDIGVAGSGTENYLTKWGSGGKTLFDSQVYDNSTFVGIGGTAITTDPHIYVEANTGNVGIGTTNPSYKLEVTGDGYFSTNLSIGGTANIGNIATVADNNRVLTSSGVGSGNVQYIDTSSWDKSSADDVWMLDGDSGTPQVIGAGDTAFFQGGIGIGTTVGGSDDLTIYVDEAFDFSWLGTHSYSAADIDFISATGFTMDVTNDLYLDADGGDILFADNGSWYGGWEAGGNFGIGTTNPNQALELEGNIKIGTTDGTRYIFFEDGAGTGLTYPGFRFNTADDSMEYSNDGASWSDIGSGGGEWTDAGSALWLYPTEADDYLVIGGTGPADAEVKLDFNGPSWLIGGNVGIGTTDPGSLLEVSDGTITTGSMVNFTSTAVTSGDVLYLANNTANNAYLLRGQAGSSLTDRFTIDSNGELTLYDYIGTETLSLVHDGTDASITVSTGDINIGSGGGKLYIGEGGTAVDIQFGESANIEGDSAPGGVVITLMDIGDIYPDTTNTYDLGSTGFRWANIHSSTGVFYNTVGIGTSSPTSTLHVTGSILDGTPNEYGTQIRAGIIEMAANGIGYIDMHNDDTGIDYDMRIGLYGDDILAFLGGDIGVGTTNTEQAITVEGNIKIGTTDGTRYIFFDDGAGTGLTFPGFRFDTSGDTMQYSNDGSTWEDIGSGGEWSLTADSGTAQVIGAGDTAYFQGGIGIGTTVGGSDDLTIYVDESYNFAWSGTHSYSAADMDFTADPSFTMDVSNDLYFDADGGEILFADGGAWYGG
ncbi:beta strand repeat-containing protein, partial [Patescibacteria group bacterium]